MARNLAKKNLPADLNKFQRINSTGRRSVKASNDNDQNKARPEPKATFSRLLNPANNNKSLGGIKNYAVKGERVIKATSATWFIIGITWILYVVQFIFAILSLIGMASLLAYDSSLVDYLDFFDFASDGGEMVMYTGMFISFAMGILTFIVALAIFVSRRVDSGRSLSIFVAALCFSSYAVPGLNLIPWAWLWCLYVVKSQID